MQIHITARHINLTEAITNYLTKKVNRLERHYDHLVWANAILWVEKHRHLAEIVIHSPLHTLRAQMEAGDLYTAIDLVVDRVDKQLKKLKEKQKDQRVKARRASLRPMDSYYGPIPDALPMSSPWPQAISVVKQVSVKPTGIEDAIRTMDSLGYTFWMFLNKSSKRLNVIFKRIDQTYGILEPAPK